MCQRMAIKKLVGWTLCSEASPRQHIPPPPPPTAPAPARLATVVSPAGTPCNKFTVPSLSHTTAHSKHAKGSSSLKAAHDPPYGIPVEVSKAGSMRLPRSTARLSRASPMLIALELLPSTYSKCYNICVGEGNRTHGGQQKTRREEACASV
jgi:hypothetical protein